MTRVDDRVAAYVADHPGQTADAIALALRIRRASVLGVLKFSGLFEYEEGPKRSRVWKLASGFTGRAGTRQLSQADRMLALLQDGHWHDIGELSAIGVGRPNSRANDLRNRGLIVEWRRDPSQRLASKAHQYRLVPLGEEGSGETATDPGRSPASEVGFARAAGTVPYQSPSSPSGAADGVSRGAGEQSGAALDSSGQLTFVGEPFRRQAAA